MNLYHKPPAVIASAAVVADVYNHRKDTENAQNNGDTLPIMLNL